MLSRERVVEHVPLHLVVIPVSWQSLQRTKVSHPVSTTIQGFVLFCLYYVMTVLCVFLMCFTVTATNINNYRGHIIKSSIDYMFNIAYSIQCCDYKIDEMTMTTIYFWKNESISLFPGLTTAMAFSQALQKRPS